MKFFILSDLHGNNSALKKLAKEIGDDDVLIIAGDLTHFGGSEDVDQLFKGFLPAFNNILAVFGNCDYHDVDEWLDEHDLNISGKARVFNGYTFFGAGGSTPCPGATPSEFSEAEFEALFKSFTNPDGNPLIFVIHQPPLNTGLDKISTGLHVGSKAVRKAIETFQPELVVSGHIHESRGIDQLGESLLVNPGQGALGFYAVYDCQEKTLELKKI